MAIYGHVFLHLRGRIQGIVNNDTAKLTRATKFMVLYPAVYVVLTLPIAVGRMVVMTGTEEMPDVFFIVSGCLLTSCGWIDALLYALTRRILVSNHLSDAPTPHDRPATAATHATNPARPADMEDFDLMALKKEASTSRTVTIVGGSASRLSRVMDLSRGRSTRSTGLGSAREHSPTGSQDSIIRKTPEPLPGGVQVHTDIEVEVEVETPR
jgi:hypothetical protein